MGTEKSWPGAEMKIKLGQEGVLPGLKVASRCLSLKKTDSASLASSLVGGHLCCAPAWEQRHNVSA